MATFIDILEIPTAGKAGHVAASTARESRLVRLVDANVNAGLVVTGGATAGKTCKVPTTDAEVKAAIGILIDPEFLNTTTAAADYLAGDEATVLEAGYIWATCEETVLNGDQVFVRTVSDGSGNTVLGTVRKTSDYPAGGVVITPDAALVAVISSYVLTLSDGVVKETFSFSTDASPTAAEVSVGLVALVDASANFASTGTTTISITSTTGVVDVLAASEGLNITTPARAQRLPGAKFATARTGAGLVKVRLNLPNN